MFGVFDACKLTFYPSVEDGVDNIRIRDAGRCPGNELEPHSLGLPPRDTSCLSLLSGWSEGATMCMVFKWSKSHWNGTQPQEVGLLGDRKLARAVGGSNCDHTICRCQE